MVFCNSQTLADLLVELLKTTGATLKLAGKVDLGIDRIFGIWIQCKDLKGWYDRFRREPNVYADQCDILLCATVIGAGFSVDSHFRCFHAFWDLRSLWRLAQTDKATYLFHRRPRVMDKFLEACTNDDPTRAELVAPRVVATYAPWALDAGRDGAEDQEDIDNDTALLLSVRQIVDRSRSCRDTVGVDHQGLASSIQQTEEDLEEEEIGDEQRSRS
jgi:hypothetical protein